MERKKYFYILIFCLLALNSTAQNHKSIYKAYISGDMAKWKKTIDSIEALPDKTNPSQPVDYKTLPLEPNTITPNTFRISFNYYFDITL